MLQPDTLPLPQQTAMTKLSIRAERGSILSTLESFCKSRRGFQFQLNGQDQFRIRRKILGPVQIVFSGQIPPQTAHQDQAVSDILLSVLDARFVPLRMERRELMQLQAMLSQYFGKDRLAGRAAGAADPELVRMLDKAQRHRRLTPEDLQTLKKAIVADRRLSRGEMETVCHINEALTEKSPEWENFYINALFLFFAGLTRVLTPKDEAQLLEWIHNDALIDDRTELKLMIHIVRRFNQVSPAFNAHILDLVRKNILESTTPLFTDSPRTPGMIDVDDVIALRRIILGVGSEGGSTVSKSEAAFLFDLDKATAHTTHAPEWRDFYVQSMASALQDGGEAALKWLAKRLGDAPATPNQRALLATLRTHWQGQLPDILLEKLRDVE